MGWISQRSMRAGCSLYSGGPKRKGPLKSVVAIVAHGSGMFGHDHVLLECGHFGKSYGGKRAICVKCASGIPMETENVFGVDVAESIRRFQVSNKRLIATARKTTT